MAHSSKYTRGLTKIEFADILGDGGAGTSFSQLGLTSEDSCVMSTDDPTITEFFSEESDTAIDTSTKEGKTTLKFSIPDPDIETLTGLLGGTAIGAAPNRVWYAPDSIQTIEKTIKITPQKGFASFIITRASIVAKMNSTFSKKNLFMLDVTATVLLPTKTGEKKIKIAE